MDTLNLPERELLNAFRSTAKCYDAELEHYSPDDLARLGSLLERGYITCEEKLKVPVPSGGWAMELLGISLTEKGLLATR